MSEIKQNSMALAIACVGVALALSFASGASAQRFKEKATCKLTYGPYEDAL